MTKVAGERHDPFRVLVATILSLRTQDPVTEVAAERLFALADQLEARLRSAQRQVDTLTPSLLARAFAGKLVPQDPNDEPATTLLERIRSTRSGE